MDVHLQGLFPSVRYSLFTGSRDIGLFLIGHMEHCHGGLSGRLRSGNQQEFQQGYDAQTQEKREEKDQDECSNVPLACKALWVPADEDLCDALHRANLEPAVAPLSWVEAKLGAITAGAKNAINIVDCRRTGPIALCCSQDRKVM